MESWNLYDSICLCVLKELKTTLSGVFVFVVPISSRIFACPKGPCVATEPDRIVMFEFSIQMDKKEKVSIYCTVN